MKISKTMKNRFIEELKYVSDKMKQAKGLDEKLYYFSAVYGMAQRIFNFEFDPELIFIHQITQLAYNQIQQRFNIFKSGQQVAVGIPEQLYTVLQNLVEEMASRI